MSLTKEIESGTRMKRCWNWYTDLKRYLFWDKFGSSTLPLFTMDFSKIAVGEKISYTDYLTVSSKNDRDGSIVVSNAAGQNFTVKGRNLIESMHSGSQFSKTEKISRTAMVEILETAGDKVFTVTFDKADGAERVLTGHLISLEPKMGRSQVRDLNILTGNPLRLVDHRTLKSLIINDIKYTAK